MKKLLISIIFLTLSHSLYSQTAKYSNDFLSIGVGARPLAMGRAVASHTTDVSSGYWNPAGLSSLESSYQGLLMHSEYFAGIAKYDYGAFSKKIDSLSGFAVSVVRFGIDDIPNTINLINSNGQIDYSKISSFSAQDYGFFASYGRRLKIQGLKIGGSAKVVRRTLGDFGNSWGFGLDAGLQYQRGNWNFGLMARDISTTFNAWTYNLDDRTKEVFEQTGNIIPENSMEITLPSFVAGASRKFYFKKFTALMEVNAVITTDGMRNTFIKSDIFSVDPQAGLELGYHGLVFLRAGICNIQEVREAGQRIQTAQPNFGLGVKLFNLRLDYALTNVGDVTGLLTHVFSLRADLNPKGKL
jgi:hypothetical protein